jgi:hypothetical protein
MFLLQPRGALPFTVLFSLDTHQDSAAETSPCAVIQAAGADQNGAFVGEAPRTPKKAQRNSWSP